MAEQKLSRGKIERLFSKYQDIMSVDEAAEALRCRKKIIYDILTDGTLQSFKIGSTYKIPKEWLIDYIIEYGYLNTENIMEERTRKVLWFCSQNPKSNSEIAAHIGVSAGFCRTVILQGLINNGKLKRMIDTKSRGNICLYKAVGNKSKKQGAHDEV